MCHPHAALPTGKARRSPSRGRGAAGSRPARTESSGLCRSPAFFPTFTGALSHCTDEARPAAAGLQPPSELSSAGHTAVALERSVDAAGRGAARFFAAGLNSVLELGFNSLNLGLCDDRRSTGCTVDTTSCSANRPASWVKPPTRTRLARDAIDAPLPHGPDYGACGRPQYVTCAMAETVPKRSHADTNLGGNPA